MFTCVPLGRYVASTVLSVPEPFGGRWPRRWWTAARRWRVPLQWRNQIWQSLEEDAGKRSSECATHPVLPSLSLSLMLSPSLRFLPPSPYPYASIYIQQPHTADTSFFRCYWKGWLTCIHCKMLSKAGRQAPDLDKSAALGPNKSVGTRDDDALNSLSVSSIKLFVHNPRQTNTHTWTCMHTQHTYTF